MRKRVKLKTATIPIHNSSKVRKEIEYLMEFSPSKTKIQGHLRNQDLKKFKQELEEKYPIKLAATFSKSKGKKIALAYPTKSERKWARKYFKKARDLTHGKYVVRTVTRNTRFTYSEYINSSVWTNRRNRYFKTHKHLCEICGIGSRIHLHHMVYTAFNGTEPDTNLVALCDEHHRQFHAKHGSSGNMKVNTLAFIAELKVV